MRSVFKLYVLKVNEMMEIRFRKDLSGALSKISEEPGELRDDYQKRFDEGYTQAALGYGEWVPGGFDRIRLLNIHVFYHPDGRIATVETPKQQDRDGHSLHGGGSYEAEYTKKEFEAHVEKYKVTLCEKQDLTKILTSSDK